MVSIAHAIVAFITMQFSFDEFTARLLRFPERLKRDYPRDEAARRMQAGQWINWPLFISQPIVPVLLFLFPSTLAPIVIVLLVINVLWMRTVSQLFVSLPLAKFGSAFVQLKWLACPLMALLLWQTSHVYIATIALAWPVLVIVFLFVLWPIRSAAHLLAVEKKLAAMQSEADR
jgi:hypothetical protein